MLAEQINSETISAAEVESGRRALKNPIQQGTFCLQRLSGAQVTARSCSLSSRRFCRFFYIIP